MDDKITERLDGLSDLDAEALAGLAADIRTAYTELAESLGEAPTDEQVDAIEALASAAEAVDAEEAVREGRAAKAAKAAARVADLDAKREAKATEAAEAKAAEEAALAEAEAIVEAETEVIETEVEVVEEVEVEVVDADVELDAVAASAAKPALPKAGAVQAARTDVKSTIHVASAINLHGTSSLTAAAEVPGYTTGQELNTMGDVAKAFIARMGSTGARSAPVQRGEARMTRDGGTRYPVASIHKPFSADLTVDSPSDIEQAMAAIKAATDEKSLPGGSLVASGGWCAPSETMYDFCVLESTEGLWSFPEITASRGGINYVQDGGISFADIYSDPNAAFSFSEANDAATPPQYNNNATPPVLQNAKVCYDVPCPTFTECRLSGYGICIRSGLLMLRSYPELVQRVIEGALVAHRHRMSVHWLNEAVSLATAVNMALLNGLSHQILGALELQITDLRLRHRMAASRSIEAILPLWIRPMIRSDLAKRLGVELLGVTDAQIDGWFRLRGVNPQWVAWQDSFDGAPAPTLGAATPATQWPTQATVLLYPSGAFTLATSDIFSIEMLVDSALLGTNDHIALFTEDAGCLLATCPGARAITLTNFCADGSTAAGASIACSSV